jgi:acyl dehydratase
MSPRTPVYLDDLSVGDTVLTDTHTIDEQQIVDFATRFDPQPFHLDPDAAQHTYFAGLAASGWHTAALSMRLMVTSGIPLADGIIGAGGEISWPRPTRPGDVLRVRMTVLAIQPSRSRPDQALVTVEGDTLNQDGDVVQHLVTRIVVWRRPSTG